MAEGLGNEAMSARLLRSAGQRDAMLTFIAERLRKVRDVQLQESALLHQKERWWRDLAWQQKGVWLPEPERWAPTARAYREAAEALAAGRLSRAAALLDRAVDLERASIEAVPKGLGIHPDEDGEAGGLDGGPAGMEPVGPDEGCPERALPKEIGLADAIERFSHTAREIRQIRVEPHTPSWWEEEEEEEKAEEEGG
jgi:hypothetical protein